KKRQQIKPDKHRKRHRYAETAASAIEPQHDHRPENAKNKWRDRQQYPPLPYDLRLDLLFAIRIGGVIRQLREAQFFRQKTGTGQLSDQIAAAGLDRKPDIADAFGNILSLPWRYRQCRNRSIFEHQLRKLIRRIDTSLL